jgi:pyruvate dehydrogenase E2 component (dihydrolipoamide acetyltransferase)
MTRLTLPQLSIAMEEARVVRWLVEDGSQVDEGQPVVEIETDKATMELEAPVAGVITVVAPEGELVAVDALLADIAAKGEVASDRLSPGPQIGTTASAAPSLETLAEAETESPADTGGASDTRESGRVRASPAARRYAAEAGVDIARVASASVGGRVSVEDVKRYADSAALGVDEPREPSQDGIRPGERTLRDIVLANITASWQQIPHIHISGQLSATGLVRARDEVKRAGIRATVTDLLIAAITAALQEVPELNIGRQAATVLNGGVTTVNLALAVATPQGVVAPVIRDVGSMNLEELTRERSRLVAEARAGTAEPRDLAGGTITLSNLGSFPVDFFAPIVSGPQAAMVATGRIREVPVVEKGLMVVRSCLLVNVAIDHRKADGEAGGRFLAALESSLTELPSKLRGSA